MARQQERFRARYGPWAVVAGASEGLGAEFATQIAARGLNVVMIARRQEMLASLSAQLTQQHHIETRTLALDLAREDSGAVVAQATHDLDVGLLVYNAALTVIGPFFERPLDDHVTEGMVNCRAPMTLTYLLGERMIARGRGGVVLMSSMSATMGSAYIANYAATKAYNMILAEGLWEELRGKGVDVMASAAAAVSTPGYIASTSKRVAAMTPRDVVAQTLAAIGKYPSFIPGASNRATAFALRRLMPRAGAIRLMGRVMQGMYGNDGKSA